MNTETYPEITEVEVNNINSKTMYLLNGVLVVNSLALPPVNSQPVKCNKIIIYTNPKLNVWSATKLCINYLLSIVSTSNVSPKN